MKKLLFLCLLIFSINTAYSDNVYWGAGPVFSKPINQDCDYTGGISLFVGRGNEMFSVEGGFEYLELNNVLMRNYILGINYKMDLNYVKPTAGLFLGFNNNIYYSSGTSYFGDTYYYQIQDESLFAGINLGIATNIKENLEIALLTNSYMNKNDNKFFNLKFVFRYYFL